MRQLWVNNKRKQCIFNIPKIEQHYEATYVGQFCVPQKNGEWTDFAVAVFYQKNPKPGHSHYFGIHKNADGKAVIFNATDAVSGTFYGQVALSGEVIYSAFSHDYCESEDKSVVIDGGRVYTKINGLANRFVMLKVIDGELQVLEDEYSLSLPG